ncbi:MAG TPA: gamma-glutamylcyclotransferase family protein [Candidatus Binataceae bacterium]|nr:gamma-glutamylcyclotransferase family protein [Candidatus Binataceae bacterium]
MNSADESAALFVYGSLIDSDLRERLLGRAVAASSAWLPGYERRRGRHYYVVKHDGARTDGLLLEGLGPRDFALLERYEEVPVLYVRERVEVIDEHGATRSCWLYLPTARLLGDRG